MPINKNITDFNSFIVDSPFLHHQVTLPPPISNLLRATYQQLFIRIHHHPALISGFLFALEKHEGQHYSWKNNTKIPYAYHIAQTALIMITTLSTTPEHILSALWHDILEDHRATPAHITFELRKQVYTCLNRTIIQESINLLNKNNFSTEKEYLRAILSNHHATIIKTADFTANLDACLDRFHEMLSNEQRFWIYEYLTIIPALFIDNLSFANHPLAPTLRTLLTSRINKLASRISPQFQNELTNFKAPT